MSPVSTLQIGFLPLLDCAPLVIARELGYFAAEGVSVELRKAQTWAQIREWLLSGQLEAAHMLITMPIQCTLGMESAKQQIDFAYTLNRRGNGIILGNALWNAGAKDAKGLAAYMQERSQEKLRFGVVFPRGTQEYFLRYWLAQAGLAVGDRISLVIIPPQELVGRLRKKEIEGFCVAEPWSRRAAASKLGRLVAESGTVLPGLADKVLAVKDSWHQAHAGEHARLLRALSRARLWLEDPANQNEAVELLASRRYVNTPKSVVEGALVEERISREAAGPVPAGQGPDHPSPEHVRWYIDQMVRWSHLDIRIGRETDISRICLGEFHREALLGLH